jgi:hypothetical protein
VRRRVAADPLASREKEGFEHPGAGALAIRAGDVHDARRPSERQPSEHLEHTIEAEIDLAWRERLQPRQPVVERALAHRHSSVPESSSGALRNLCTNPGAQFL